MPGAGLSAVRRTVTRATGKTHEQTFWKRTDAEHAQARAQAGRDQPGNQFHPQQLAKLREMGVKKLPPGNIPPSQVRVNMTGDVHSHAVLSWRDSAGRSQSEYTQRFRDAHAAEKWDRVSRLEPRVASVTRGLEQQARAGSDAHAAALVIAQTGLRPGSEGSVAQHGHYGVTTMEARHVERLPDGSARISYTGKAGETNVATVRGGAARELLRRAEDRAPGERVFRASASDVRAAVPRGVHPKDFRTVMGTRTAREALAARQPPPPMTGNARTDARNVARGIRAASIAASRALNNTPSVARSSYIHPSVFAEWMRSVGAR